MPEVLGGLTLEDVQQIGRIVREVVKVMQPIGENTSLQVQAYAIILVARAFVRKLPTTTRVERGVRKDLTATLVKILEGKLEPPGSSEKAALVLLN